MKACRMKTGQKKTGFLLPAILIAILCLALYPSAPLHAAPLQENPKALQGLWSSPDCANTNRLLVISKYFLMFSSHEKLSIDTARTWRNTTAEGEMLYALQPVRGQAIILNRTNDGLLQIRQKALGDGQGLEASWALLKNEEMSEYSHCAKLFDSTPSLGQTEINTIFFLDMAVELPSCKKLSAADSPAARNCQGFLFTLADQDQNERLNQGELARFYQQIAFLEAGFQSCFLAPEISVKSIAFADYTLQENGQKDIAVGDIPGLILKERNALKNQEHNNPLWSAFLDRAEKLHNTTTSLPSQGDKIENHPCPVYDQKAPEHKEPQKTEIQWNAPRTPIPENAE